MQTNEPNGGGYPGVAAPIPITPAPSYSPPPPSSYPMPDQYQPTGGESNYKPGVATPVPGVGYQAGVSTPQMLPPTLPVNGIGFGQVTNNFQGGSPYENSRSQISDPNQAWNEFWYNFQSKNPIPTAYSNSVMPGIGGYNSLAQGFHTTYLGPDGRRYWDPFVLNDPWARVERNIYDNQLYNREGMVR